MTEGWYDVGIMNIGKTSSKATEILRSAPSFSELDTATLNAVARAAIRRVYDPGQMVLIEGQPNSGLSRTCSTAPCES